MASSMDQRRYDKTSSPDGIAYRLSWLVRLPLQLCLDVYRATWGSFRSCIPELIPLAVFVISIPVLLFFSFSAGWFVWRSIAVGWEMDMYLQYGDGVTPYAEVFLPPVSVQQPYDVSLHLVIPVTPANVELGNFMTTLTISSTNNQTIAFIRRPSLVIPPSSRIWPFILRRSNTITVDITLLSNVVLGTNNAVARLELGRNDQWRSLGSGEAREVSVSSALLRGVVVHKGLRGLLTRFPLLTALIASGVFFFLSFVVLASCLLPAIEWRVHGSTEAIDPVKQERPVRVIKRELGVPLPKPARTRRSRSLSTPTRQRPSSVMKEENQSVLLPSSSSANNPLRRRRSRQLQTDHIE